jgi:hypothetical protein
MVKCIHVTILLYGAYYIFPKGKITEVTPFARAMPERMEV